jgi:WD40 repeat protein
VCSEILLHDRNIGLTSTLIHGDVFAAQVSAPGWRAESLFGEPTSGVKSLAFSPDGSLLASGSYDSTVRLWKVSNGSLIKTFTGHNMPVTAVAFSPDGKLLTSASYDGSIKLYDVEHQQILQTMIENSGAILSLSFSEDGKILAIGGSGLAWAWEIQSDFFVFKDKPRFRSIGLQVAFA